MTKNERKRLEEHQAQQQEQFRQFDRSQQKRLKTGKILVITASVCSFLSALLLMAMGMMFTGTETGAALPLIMFALAAAGVAFPAFMIAGFNWARDGFLVTQAVKTIMILGALLHGELNPYLTPVSIVILLVWLAFYVTEIFVFGFYQPIREYQYDRLTRPDPFEEQ